MISKKLKLGEILTSKAFDLRSSYRKDEGVDDGLADSIREYGLLNALRVVKMRKRYLLVGGYRRRRALMKVYGSSWRRRGVECVVFQGTMDEAYKVWLNES